jgi:hypothetical protein
VNRQERCRIRKIKERKYGYSALTFHAGCRAIRDHNCCHGHREGNMRLDKPHELSSGEASHGAETMAYERSDPRPLVLNISAGSRLD